MKSHYFTELLTELGSRAARATVSRLGFSNNSLRAYLERVFSSSYGSKGSFVGDPVFEATFGWKEADESLSELSGTLLAPALVDALDSPGGDIRSSFRFPRQAHPYSHQLEAWRILSRSEPQSVVVTSGTGSGKTECFMVPILDQLVRDYTSQKSQLVGVQALFLYPLNALIQSQRERLDAWTMSFGDGVRYSLYNGLTPQNQPKHQRDQHPNEALDRESLRALPPPLLVTNATMLEYMLVRAQDAPILEQSQGKLKWIVLDEAHTYIGSQAAELALLLRRVLHAFGVTPEQVRFVATSATIGGDEAEAQLQEFLARVSGLGLDRVHVVSGQRSIQQLTTGSREYCDASLEVLESLGSDPAKLYGALCAHETAKSIRSLFTPPNNRIVTLSDLAKKIGGSSAYDDAQIEKSVRWLDLLTRARSQSKEQSGTSFLPLRAHIFHNVLDGLWACANQNCPCKDNTELDSPEWPFGIVYTETRRHCDCGSPVYELRSCNDCNTTYLWARRYGPTEDGTYRLIQTNEGDPDEFSLDVERAEDDESDTEYRPGYTPVLLANGHGSTSSEFFIDPESLTIDPVNTSDALCVQGYDETIVDGGETVAMVCPECGGHDHAVAGGLFRKAMLGAPFLMGEIVPTLLEFCPDIDSKDSKPLERPYRGRRMITFTDSRQGTARIAARLQQDSERNRIRGLVFEGVLSEGGSGSDVERIKIQSEIDALSTVLKVGTNPAIQNIYDEKVRQLNSLAGYKPVSFSEMVNRFGSTATDVREWMYNYYRELDPTEFGQNTGREILARILLTREFGRRPKRVNSLETMGLVRVVYPKLETIQEVPGFSGLAPAIALDDWKDFLKIALDFHVRENTFVDLPEAWRKWGGSRLSAKQLMPPDSKESQTNRFKRWPQCLTIRRQSRLVRLLARGLEIDPQTQAGRNAIDAILRGAWDQLVNLRLLESAGGTGRFLKLENLSLAPIEKGWLCPVTRRVLDTTFKGLTPYLPESVSQEMVEQCIQLEMPDYREISNLDLIGDDRVNYVRNWVNSNESISSLRKLGLWSDLNDRILEGGFYFRAAEHSAQQSGVRLAKYETEFKSGRINLLSCSTTMEMGVDIGGISVVAMNNVPPHPANYLQRAGRAGRRGESRSVALSLCKSNPHDQQVFANPLWPFNTVLPAPKVLLSSPILVQRHLNSMLLANFLRKELDGTGTAEKLDLEWWLLPANGSRQQRFSAWADCFNSTRESRLAKGLQSLLRHTPQEGSASLERLVSEAGRMAAVHAKKWFAEFNAVERELSPLSSPKNNNDPAKKALEIQKKRLTGEYLLRELATEGFLPGYGFPTDITPLDTLTAEELKRNSSSRDQRGESSRIDNRMRFRDLPSRDMVTALREYAPGSEVVIDGLVYRSAGITLNWHIPASVSAVNEIQNIRDAWRCRQCGSSGTNIRANKVHDCPDCGARLASDDSETRFDYLEPAGFAVDLYSSPHNDVSTQTFVPVSRPWINANGDWLSLPNPVNGIFRSSTDGSLFHHSSGIHGHGFSVCLSCGRAEPEEEEGQLSPVFYDRKKGVLIEHRRLRGTQGSDSAICDGSFNAYSIQRDLRLGHESRTDVLEIALRGLDGQPIQDRCTAYTLAVAIRNSIASALGIESSELGCDTKPIRMLGEGMNQAIVIFDKNPSGYVSSVADQLPHIFRLAANQFECIGECDSACQHCLLDFDTRFSIDDLDRHAGRRFLSDQWLNSLELPAELAIFGDTSMAEYQTLPEAITRELAIPASELLRLYLHGSPLDWDIPASTLRRQVAKWSATGVRIELVVEAESVADISAADKSALAALGMLDGVSIRTGSKPEIGGSSIVLAEIVQAGRLLAWAGKLEISIPDSSWGESGASSLVRGWPGSSLVALTPLELKVVEPSDLPAKTVRVEIHDELDGTADGFGKRMLDTFIEHLGVDIARQDERIVSVEYHDRYMNAPLPVSLLLDFICALRDSVGDSWEVSQIGLSVTPIPEMRFQSVAPNKIWQNWIGDKERERAVVAAFDYAGLQLDLDTVAKHDAAHARRFDIGYADGKFLKIWFDQGFSYWQVPRERTGYGAGRTFYPFSGNYDRQAESIGSPGFSVEGQSYPTYVFLGWS